MILMKEIRKVWAKSVGDEILFKRGGAIKVGHITGKISAGHIPVDLDGEIVSVPISEVIS